MRVSLAARVAILLWAAMPAAAHRLDEYLQAATISIEKDRVQAQLRLTPGVAVLPFVLAGIDTNGDGVVSEAEERAYGARVLSDLSLSLDGAALRPRLDSMKFPSLDEMREGRGEIQMEISADLPRAGGNRRLTFENRHDLAMAAYLVNCLVPRDTDIRVTAQNRNYGQSFYELEYAQAGGVLEPFSLHSWPGGRVWLGVAGLLLLARFALLWRQRLRLNTP